MFLNQKFCTAVLFTILTLVLTLLHAQTSASWTIHADNEYRVVPDITYTTANNYDCKLDVYARIIPGASIPTVLYIHGGGWVTGSKESYIMNILPYLEMGLSVVNVEYRLARVSLAPAAVEDCRLALRWIFKNAKEYGFDTTRVIVTGGSAGGHLALMTGMLQSSDGFDMPTDWDYSNVKPEVAVIINWYGITDVLDLLNGPDMQNYAVYWLGTQPDKETLARRVSPLSYIRKDLPPVFTVHGDQDDLVPYSHAVQLHQKLTQVGVPNQLMIISAGKHGDFSKEEMNEIYTAIKAFLKEHKIIDD